jgi:hypothetical protein
VLEILSFGEIADLTRVQAQHGHRHGCSLFVHMLHPLTLLGCLTLLWCLGVLLPTRLLAGKAVEEAPPDVRDSLTLGSSLDAHAAGSRVALRSGSPPPTRLLRLMAPIVYYPSDTSTSRPLYGSYSATHDAYCVVGAIEGDVRRLGLCARGS